MRLFYVYITCSKKNGTLYVGVTSNLARRMFEHRNKLLRGFSSKYGVSHLVYYEEFQFIRDALIREKQIKKWHRQWKLRLIEEVNPDWKDLYEERL